MDKKTDEAILVLNKRYQDLLDKTSHTRFHNIGRYINYIKHFQFGRALSDLRYRSYALKHFTSSGNVSYETQCGEKARYRKIAVYSCITGGYEKIVEPIYVEEDVDYFMFTDTVIPAGSAWKFVDIKEFPEYNELTPAQMNRRIKMLPFNYLPEYDYSIYVDGNIEIVAPLSPMVLEMGTCVLGVHYHNYRDCIFDELIAIEHFKRIDKEMAYRQLSAYDAEGFPRHYGLYENGMIIRKHDDLHVQELMNKWWEEYLKYPTRDQFSLPYMIWKTNFDRATIHILGNNLNRNPRINRSKMHT